MFTEIIAYTNSKRPLNSQRTVQVTIWRSFPQLPAPRLYEKNLWEFHKMRELQLFRKHMIPPSKRRLRYPIVVTLSLSYFFPGIGNRDETSKVPYRSWRRIPRTTRPLKCSNIYFFNNKIKSQQLDQIQN